MSDPLDDPRPGDALRVRAVELLRRGVNAALRASRDALYLRRTPPEDPSRIVVHMIGNVGDVAVGVPALMGLRERFPRARITLVTSPGPAGLAGGRDLLSGVPYLDEIVEYSLADLRARGGPLRLLATFRRLRPDVLVMSHGSLATTRLLVRNLLFSRLTGARFAAGFSLGYVPLWIHAQVRHGQRFPQEAWRRLDHVRELGVRQEVRGVELAPLAPASRAKVDAITSRVGPFAALCPGGKQGGHLWRPERFVEVARRLRERYGLALVTVGSRKERERCDEVLLAAGGGYNAAGELSLIETAELLGRARMMLTNDTGPMHLAAAKGTLVVAVFGGYEYPGRWYPLGDGHEVLRARLACERCLMNSEYTDHCVRHITVDAVWAACERVLARRGVAPVATARDAAAEPEG